MPVKLPSDVSQKHVVLRRYVISVATQIMTMPARSQGSGYGSSSLAVSHQAKTSSSAPYGHAG